MSQVDLSQLAIDRSVSSSTRGHTRFRLLTRYILPGTLIIGFLALIFWVSRDLISPPKSVTVMPVIVTKSAIRNPGTPLFQAAGWVEPRPTPIRVAALSPGVIEQLLVVEDQSVKKGEPIALLVRADAELTYKHSLASMKLREADLQQMKAILTAAQIRLKQPVHREAVLRAAEAELAKNNTELKNLPFKIRTAKAQLNFAKNDYDRRISAKTAVTQRTIDEALTTLESAKATFEELDNRHESLMAEHKALKARCDALQKELELLTEETQERDETIAKVNAAEAQLEHARVTAEEAKLSLDRMTIRAPVDGRIYRLIGHPGSSVGNMLTQMVGYDGSTVVTMYRPEMLQIRVDVRFEDIPKVDLRQPVQIKNPALSKPVTGKVLYISSEADIQKNTLQVKVEIETPSPLLKPEMLVDVTFLAPTLQVQNVGKNEESHISIPRKMIERTESGQNYVWIVDQSDSIARLQLIETEPNSNGPFVEVKQGLDLTSHLISSPTAGLKPGDRIKISGETDQEGN
ncbi:MAG: HlyD family efflux transporter periplasmic adaptor subunit [Planctomycetes bacterium]|nr:HlyD family efflux transporter periplasmic adaptor subunit [Planctomycetota bacterium]MCH9724804.1 HlyD family efflux transporter periplasmic adaptor subunit [Planctomycetota bacterium]MCH9778744.1 HlyD family efflux transporter periplasmic adaptor subunit [Planctomycetota bacterium]MCH9790598.1 HlyD family efflux transporter periplasmic adaptor subunit [Planctomycetota bacterium]